MKCRPMLMATDLMRAIRREVDPKTQTRRPMKGVDGNNWIRLKDGTGNHVVDERSLTSCPYGVPGDRIWFRESARVIDCFEQIDGKRVVTLEYVVDGARVDGIPYPARLKGPVIGACVPNGVHREGARTFAEVTEVRVERLRSISEADALAEGVTPVTWGADACAGLGATLAFSRAWDACYGAGAWDRSGWVWAVSFKRLADFGAA